MIKSVNMALAFVAVLGIQNGALAHQHFQDYTITDGSGDGVRVHHGLFGSSREKDVHDRLGDKFMNKQGLFSQTEGANMLGNAFVKHEGLGGSQFQASDMFGDRIQSRTTALGFGRKQTNVDLSGMTGIAQSLLSSKFGPHPLFDPSKQNPYLGGGQMPTMMAPPAPDTFNAAGFNASGADAAGINPADFSSAGASAAGDATLAPFSSRRK